VSEGGDRLAAFEARLAAIRARTTGKLAERAEAIAAAAARHDAGDDGARDEVRRLAHKLRGVASGPLHEAATALERAAAEGGAMRAHVERIVELAQDAQEPSVAERPSAEATGIRILAVDDDAAILRITELSLQRMGGFTVHVARDEDDTARALDTGPFALVLLDAMLPGTNGLALCARVRAHPMQGEARIVVLSAASPEELGWEIDDAGPDEWWRKPLPPTELVQRVRDLTRAIPDSVERRS